MANSYTLHPTRSRIKAVQRELTPLFTEELLVAVARGRVTTWAVHIDHDMATCEWVIGKVEPWDAYRHINAELQGILQVYGRDEVDAYMNTRRALDKTNSCEKH
jgi:hypothetical protein